MTDSLQYLLDKEAIRDLALLYSRGVDRADLELVADLYTEDATDTHGDTFDGSAADFCKFLAGSLPHLPYSGHHICNHLIAIDGDVASGEVYALAFHVFPDRSGGGGRVEDMMAVRYIDNYRRCADGKWRFSKRVVTYDMHVQRLFTGDGTMGRGAKDPSYEVCREALFARGARVGG